MKTLAPAPKPGKIPAKFFLPEIKTRDHAVAYQNIIEIIKDQLKIPITDRKIFSISFTRDKKHGYHEVGQLDEQERRYRIVAIFEANPFVVYTRSKDGGTGVMILVSREHITDIQDFPS